MGSPSHAAGLHKQFSPWVCLEIDKGLAQYVRWYEARFEATRKAGKHKIEQRFKTLSAVLGMEEEQRRGGFTGEQLTDLTTEYRQAVIQAMRAGEPMPDIQEWMAKKRGELS